MSALDILNDADLEQQNRLNEIRSELNRLAITALEMSDSLFTYADDTGLAISLELLQTQLNSIKQLNQ